MGGGKLWRNEMSIFRNVVLNLQTEEECERAIILYKKQLSSLTNDGILDAQICRLSKESILFFATIDTEDYAKKIFEGLIKWRKQQKFDLIDSLVFDGPIEWHKNFGNNKI